MTSMDDLCPQGRAWLEASPLCVDVDQVLEHLGPAIVAWHDAVDACEALEALGVRLEVPGQLSLEDGGADL